MKATVSQHARRMATSSTLRSMVTCVAVCAVRALSGANAPAKTRNVKSCCD